MDYNYWWEEGPWDHMTTTSDEQFGPWDQDEKGPGRMCFLYWAWALLLDRSSYLTASDWYV